MSSLGCTIGNARWKQYVQMIKQLYLLQFLSRKHVFGLVLTEMSNQIHYLLHLPLPKPELPTTPKEGTTSDTYQNQLREYCDDVQHYNEHLHRNDHAVGAINLLIEPDQFEYIKDLTTSQEVWDKLKEKHANFHTGLATFYMKMGILKKKYTDGEDLHAHFSHITMENQKLQQKGRALLCPTHSNHN